MTLEQMDSLARRRLKLRDVPAPPYDGWRREADNLAEALFEDLKWRRRQLEERYGDGE